MEIVIVQLLVSLGLVSGAVLLYAWSVKHGDAERAEHLSLLPVLDDGDVTETHERPQKP